MQIKGLGVTTILIEEASYLRDIGTINAFAVQLNFPIFAYTNGLKIKFLTKLANTGACTLSVNGLPAKPITKSVDVSLSAGDILAHQVVECTYDGSNFQLQSGSGGGSSINVMAITSLRI